MTDLEDGVHHIDRDTYDRLVDRVNFSTLKFLERSPSHYQQNLRDTAQQRALAKLGTLDEDDTDAMQEGRVVSLAVFEREEFKRRVVVWTGGRRQGSSWNEFVDRHPDSEIVTEATYKRCIAIAAAVRSSEQAYSFLQGGVGEVTALWTHRVEAINEALPGWSMKMKGRIDYLTDDWIVDLKRTKDASPAGFGKEVARYFSHAQSALYRDGLIAIDGRERKCALIAVEPVKPYAVQVYIVEGRELEHGQQVYRTWLDGLNFCRKHNVWPAYANAPIKLELPHWMLGDEELS